MTLPPEIVGYATALLQQTRKVLAMVDAGEAIVAAEDVAKLRATERDLIALLGLDAEPSS